MPLTIPIIPATSRSEVIIIDHSSDGNLYDYVQELRKMLVDLFIDVLSILFVGCYILLGGFTEKSFDFRDHRRRCDWNEMEDSSPPFHSFYGV